MEDSIGETSASGQESGRNSHCRTAISPPIGAADPTAALAVGGCIIGDRPEVLNAFEDALFIGPWGHAAVPGFEPTEFSTLQLVSDGLVDALPLRVRGGLQPSCGRRGISAAAKRISGVVPDLTDNRRRLTGRYRAGEAVFRDACCRGGDGHQTSNKRGGAYDRWSRRAGVTKEPFFGAQEAGTPREGGRD